MASADTAIAIPTPFDLSVSYHEAGHGVAAIALDVPVAYVSVEPTTTDCGRMVYAGDTRRDVDIEHLVLIQLAGHAAEERYFPLLRCAGVLRLNSRDVITSQTLLTSMLSDLSESKCVWPSPDDVDAALAQYHARAARLVDLHWDWIDRVAQMLVWQRQLTGNEIEALR